MSSCIIQNFRTPESMSLKFCSRLWLPVEKDSAGCSPGPRIRLRLSVKEKRRSVTRYVPSRPATPTVHIQILSKRYPHQNPATPTHNITTTLPELSLPTEEPPPTTSSGTEAFNSEPAITTDQVVSSCISIKLVCIFHILV